MAQAKGWVDAPRVIAERDRILADPEFALEPSWLEQWVESVSKAIVRVLRMLPAPVLWGLLGLLSVLIVGALVRMFVTRDGRRSAVDSNRGVTAAGPAAG